jgi:hypothetical protein
MRLIFAKHFDRTVSTVCKNAVRAANHNYLSTYVDSAFEVDSEDMMTPTADSLSIPARKRL